MPSIQKLGDKWRAFVFHKGERRSAVWDTKREAESWAHKTDELLRSQKTTGGVKHTFGEAVDRYIRDVAPNKRGFKWEVRRLHTMLEYFGRTVLLQDLDAPDMAGWRDWRLKGDETRRPVTPSTVVREVNLLKHLLHTARDEWRWMDGDPFKGVKIPQENAARSARWDWQLIKRVLRAGQRAGGKTGEVTLAFHISLRTGMRLQEVLSAPSTFDPKKKIARVRTKTDPQGRDIPVGRVASRLISNAHFTVSPNEASTLFSRITKQNLITGLTFHDARATALTLMSKRLDVMTLSKVSGHRDINLLNRVYYRVTPAEIAAKLR
jgi:integrase